MAPVPDSERSVRIFTRILSLPNYSYKFKGDAAARRGDRGRESITSA
jgi:hypothetical protein